jgi:AcrR family transcriptional regulator
VPRRGLDEGRVLDAAAAIADAEGLAAVTVARVAQDLGVRPPSLYNHVAGRDALVRGIALRALRDLGAAVRDAAVGRSGHEALAAFAGAYRDYALAHPGTYAATVRAPTAGDAEHDAAAQAVVDTALAVLRGWGLEGDDAIHATRAVRAAVHGFVSIEAGGGFGLPVDREESFRRMVAALAAGLRRAPATATATAASRRARRG